jgi:hypothetical protein
MWLWWYCSPVGAGLELGEAGRADESRIVVAAVVIGKDKVVSERCNDRYWK